MMMVTPAAATALATLLANNASLVKRNLGLTSPSALQEIEDAFRHADNLLPEDDVNLVLAHVCLQRCAYQALNKFAHIATTEAVDEALVQSQLPPKMQEKLLHYLNLHPQKNQTLIVPPKTWKEELMYLQNLSQAHDNPKEWLWRQLLNHPMTAYVPVHCPKCGHVVPDSYTPDNDTTQADAQVGLVEVPPTGQELGLRSGWFRGPRRGPTVFQITCQQCQHVYHWYRSGHPKILLDPTPIGRLCGEQEDLRLTLANYLNISVRMIVPLDWDHVWTEYRVTSHDDIDNDNTSNNNKWQIEDDSSRNFACRLDEGIGSWTGVLAFHPDLELCEDVTEDYLRSQQDGGRVDHKHSDKLSDYRTRVGKARTDSTFASTQKGTGLGYVIQRAGLDSCQVTSILQQAARDFKRGGKWWDLEYKQQEC